MSNIKKMAVLFLITIFMVLGFSFAVSAENNLTISLVEVNDSKSVIDEGIQYINNGTYVFNFTIENQKGMNVSMITITLPLGFEFVAGTNVTNSTQKALSVFSNTSYNASTQQTLTWNSSDSPTPLINLSGSIGSIVYFAFNAKAALGAASDGIKNFTILTRANATGSTNHLINETHQVLNNISVDNTKPTLSTAVTKSGSTINITFSEPLNLSASGFAATSIVVNISNGATWASLGTGASFTPATTITNSNSILLVLSTGFPTNYSNWLNVTVNGTIADRAGNTVITKSYAVATDGAPPGLLSATYSYYTKELILVFNESVTSLNLAGNLIINSSVSGKKFVHITTVSSNSSTTIGTANSSTITLNDSTRDLISGWRTNLLNISFNSTLLTDAAGNAVIAQANYSLDSTRYTNDTSRPNMTIASFAYDHNTMNLTLEFNETMDLSGITVADIVLQNTSNISAGKNISLGGASVDTRQNSTKVNITVTFKQQANISSWVNGDSSSAVIYLSMFVNSSIRDLAGNSIHGVINTSAVRIPTYTKDNVAPKLKNVTIPSNSTFILRDLLKLSTPIKAGNINFSIEFDEIMDMRTTPTLNVTPSGGSVSSATCKWWNDTIANCSFTVTSSLGDGWAAIAVATAKDISQLNTMVTNTSFQFKIDTTVPKVIRAYYIDSDFSNAVTNFTSKAGANYIVLEFTENVSLAGIIGAGHPAPDEAAIFNWTGSIINLTVAGDTINATNITSDNSTSGHYRIKIQLNDTSANGLKENATNTVLTIRGIYNKNNVASGDPSGIDVRTVQSIIVDDAGNPAVPNSTPLDIADGVISFTSGVPKTISVPYCVNGTLMDQVLSGVTWACSSYTTAAWSNAISSSSSLTPLKGYKCTITGQDLEYYIYTKNQSGCSLSSVSLNQDWNLVALDGVTQANATKWFAGLGDGSQVSQWYTNIEPHTALKSSSETIAYINETADPYTGYWIFTDFDLSTKNWAGRGIY